jgi:hypothetical protein
MALTYDPTNLFINITYSQSVAYSIPALAAILAFVTYSLSGHSLDPAIIFSSLGLFQLLRQPLMFLPRLVSMFPISESIQDVNIQSTLIHRRRSKRNQTS